MLKTSIMKNIRPHLTASVPRMGNLPVYCAMMKFVVAIPDFIRAVEVKIIPQSLLVRPGWWATQLLYL